MATRYTYPSPGSLMYVRVRDPYLIGISYNHVLSAEIRIDRILGMLNAGHSLGVQRFKMHRMHKPANLLLAELTFLRLQLQRDLSDSRRRASFPFMARISAL